MTDAETRPIAELLAEQNAMLAELIPLIRAGREELDRQGRKLEQIRYSLAVDMQREYYAKVVSRQLSFVETLREVADRELSFARFGDGEFGLAADPMKNISFQTGSFELSRRLQDILSVPRDGLLIGLPGVTVDVFWMTWISRYWGVLSSLIPEKNTWGMAAVTRSEAFRRNGSRLVDAWRACWAGRRVLVVTGQGSRFEPVPELFSSASSIDYVHGPAKGAFDCLERIKAEVLTRDPELALIALGPAGTVLAADLHKMGVRSIDVGHLSNSYVEVFSGGSRPEQLPLDKGL